MVVWRDCAEGEVVSCSMGPSRNVQVQFLNCFHLQELATVNHWPSTAGMKNNHFRSQLIEYCFRVRTELQIP